ncbi:hypothetical protein SDC9_127928 [bioreactor metagenome]|uniref:Uncharacterized protein n=1 Tax=bioreactor metagenome TaxID=1076179 RepID=A0A645CVD6_9ZZZZ
MKIDIPVRRFDHPGVCYPMQMAVITSFHVVLTKKIDDLFTSISLIGRRIMQKHTNFFGIFFPGKL